jgi:hypothetical protein
MKNDGSGYPKAFVPNRFPCRPYYFMVDFMMPRAAIVLPKGEA